MSIYNAAITMRIGTFAAALGLLAVASSLFAQPVFTGADIFPLEMVGERLGHVLPAVASEVVHRSGLSS